MTIGIKRFFTALLLCMLMITLLPTAYADDTKEPEIPHFDLPCTVSAIKVGLYSGAEALDSATLNNIGGSGYDLGYYDFSRQFRKICTVSCINIIVMTDGAWHYLYDDNYDSFASAKAAAESMGGIPTYADGRFKVASQGFETETEAAAAKSGAELIYGATSVSDASDERIVLLFKSSRIDLAVMPNNERDEAKAQLLDYIYKGGFEFLQSGNKLTVINYVGIEDYVKGVLPYEVGGNWPSDALKAQAVCARSYAINNINAYIDDGFDVRADTHSQVYRGVSGTTVNTDIAADETAGKFVRYEGAICRVYYMSASGGATESGANVFGERREYLSGVTDPYELTENYYNKNWSDTKSKAYLLSKLQRNGYELSDIADIVPTYSETGNVIAIDFISSGGATATVRLTDCYMIPGVNSMRYSLSVNGDAVEFSGHGWGHNCGMSQWGAYSMAKNHGFDCDGIIDFYFSGAYIG